MVAHAARAGFGFVASENKAKIMDIQWVQIHAGGVQTHGRVDLQKAAYPRIGEINFEFPVALFSLGCDLEAAGVNRELGGSIAADFLKFVV